MNRGPIVLSIEEAELLLASLVLTWPHAQDLLPPPDKDEDAVVTKLRERLRLLLKDLRKDAEGL
ncbi:hypothetical protein HK105_207170 [Polyrhizophydium stewartii]|uniref:Uncharacterized protein n=1 Tax=Polyrhizophydium stewartii TaxID=2732419 RepID=A0ABR4N1A1_9FUNG